MRLQDGPTSGEHAFSKTASSKKQVLFKQVFAYCQVRSASQPGCERPC